MHEVHELLKLNGFSMISTFVLFNQFDSLFFLPSINNFTPAEFHVSDFFGFFEVAVKLTDQPKVKHLHDSIQSIIIIT